MMARVTDGLRGSSHAFATPAPNMMDAMTRYTGLPDPAYQPEFYADVAIKRFFAWVADAILIGLIVAALVPLTAFTALFFLPLLVLAVSFTYRSVLIANGSATLGMRLMAIELRRADGSRFDGTTAVMNTALYLMFMSMVITQIVSIVLMLTDTRARGLPDIILNTVAINRAAQS